MKITQILELSYSYILDDEADLSKSACCSNIQQATKNKPELPEHYYGHKHNGLRAEAGGLPAGECFIDKSYC